MTNFAKQNKIIISIVFWIAIDMMHLKFFTASAILTYLIPLYDVITQRSFTRWSKRFNFFPVWVIRSLKTLRHISKFAILRTKLLAAFGISYKLVTTLDAYSDRLISKFCGRESIPTCLRARCSIMFPVWPQVKCFVADDTNSNSHISIIPQVRTIWQ